MKTLRLIGMAIFAVVMCVNFTACSDDDVPSNENPTTKGKRLVETTCGDEQEVFRYNSDGWLSEYILFDFTSEWKLSYSYSEQNGKTLVHIVSSGSEGDWEKDIVADMSNSRLKDIDGEECVYDSEGHLIQCGQYKFTWENGNMIKAENRHGAVFAYAYYPNEESKKTIGNDPVLNRLDEEYGILLAHSELLGKSCKNMLKAIYRYNNNEVDYNNPAYVYTYEFDKDGYVSSCTEESYGNTETTYYKWE